jgi:pimeloyl-ACP methyl ester carboxylesterase
MCDVPPEAMRNTRIVNEAVNGSLGNFDLRLTLAKLKIPVLVIEGEKTMFHWIQPANGRKLRRTRGCC